MKQYFPQILSWSTQDDILSKQLAAVKNGICFLNDVELKMPIASMRNTFCRIYENNNLATRLNEVYPMRGIFKDGSLNLDHVDQKVLLDLSPARLRSIVENDKELIKDLGEDFLNIVSFYNSVHKNIISRLIPLAEQGIGGQLMDIHQQFNYNYRMVDYYPVRKGTRRCGEHRDYGTFTLIFQDGTVGGLEVYSNGSWIPISPDAGIIFLWGWSAEILSNRRIRAPLHRVVSVTEDGNLAPRRNAAIFFVAPDLDVKLSPQILSPEEKLAFNPESVKNLTVQQFKNIMGKKWRYREGTLASDEEVDFTEKSWTPSSQDAEIIAYLAYHKVRNETLVTDAFVSV